MYLYKDVYVYVNIFTDIFIYIYIILYISLYRHVQIGGFSHIFWNVHLRTLGGRRCIHFDEHVFPMIPMGGEDPPF